MPETPEPLSAEAAGAKLIQLLPAIEELLKPTRREFEQILAELEGTDQGSLEANQTLAEVIQTTAVRLNVAFRCTKCNEPARLRCSKSGNSPTGSFSFQHPGSTTHGATKTLPRLVLADKPPDGRKAGKL